MLQQSHFHHSSAIVAIEGLSRSEVGRGIFPELLGIQRLSTPIIHLPTHMATHSSSHTTLAHTTRITTRERAQQSAVARCNRSLPPFPPTAACSVELWPAVASCNDLWLQLITVSLCDGLIRRMYVGRERENSSHERGRAYFARPSRVSQLSLALGHVSLSHYLSSRTHLLCVCLC